MENLESAPGETVRSITSDVSVNLAGEGDREIRINKPDFNVAVPVTTAGLEALAGWVDIPKAFLERQDPILQEHILNYLLNRTSGEGLYRISEHGLLEVRTPGQIVIEPRQVVDIAMRVIDPAAPVLDFGASPDEFRLDAIVPEAFDRGIGGDPAVGDLTRGGLRIRQNRKMNHAPEISELMYRLICTNGMEVEEEDLHIDARGQSVEEVLVEIELAAQRVMGRIEERIERFYELRNEIVSTPEQAIYRIGEENGISDRVVNAVARLIPSVADDDGNVTMFDLVNLVTNQANEPTVARRTGARRILERAGGTVVHEHAERCTHCRSRLIA